MTDTNLESQLKAVRERRAALLAESEALLAESSPLDAQLATEEALERAESALLEAQRKFGPKFVALVQTEAGPVVLRAPHIAAYRKFQDAEDLDSDKTEEMVKSCLLHPSKPELDKLLRLQPGALSVLANHAAILAGHRKVVIKGK
jgi:hypothetical protein